MTLQDARKQLSDLRHEHGRLTADIGHMHSQLNSLKSSLPSLQATAERRPSESAQIKVNLAEHDIRDIEQQITRKQAALQAVESDLKVAETELKQSERTATINELRAIYNRVAELATAIDANPLDADLWCEIRQEIMTGNRLYGRSPVSLFRVDPQQQVRKYFQTIVAPKIETAAFGRNFSDTPKTLADVLGLSQSKFLLDQLSHGQPIEERPSGKMFESAFIDWVENRNKQPSLDG